MKAKTFFISTIVSILVCFGAMAALLSLLSLEDPFFMLNGIAEDETAVFNNQRYEMAGLIRHQDYSVVVMGASLAANCRASWFTEALEKKTLKITFPDGWITEFDTALRLAFRTHPGLDTVYFSLDPNILIRPDSQRTAELPEYLYNANPLDDVEYLLDADAYALALRAWMHRRSETAVTLDEAYVWEGLYSFSRYSTLLTYRRPEVSDTVLPAGAYLKATDENLDVVCRWAEEHPDTQFVIWFPPYSILYWDMMTREGSAEAIITSVEHAAERLMRYDNIAVHCFLHATNIITDLNNYTDYVHCSTPILSWMARNMMDGLWRFNEDNYKIRLDELRELAAAYDYESIFEGWPRETETNP